MKTKLLALALVGLFSINGALAQEQGDMRGSLGLVLGTKAGISDDGEFKMGFGITPAFEYVFTDAMSANASYDFYFKSSVDGGSFTLSSFNIDYRYYFMTDDVQVYGLAGIGFMKGKFKQDGGGSISNSETGLNIGVGAIFPLSDMLGFNAQLKYQTPKFQDITGEEGSNIAINAGVVYTFGN